MSSQRSFPGSPGGSGAVVTRRVAGPLRACELPVPMLAMSPGAVDDGGACVVVFAAGGGASSAATAALASSLPFSAARAYHLRASPFCPSDSCERARSSIDGTSPASAALRYSAVVRGAADVPVAPDDVPDLPALPGGGGGSIDGAVAGAAAGDSISGGTIDGSVASSHPGVAAIASNSIASTLNVRVSIVNNRMRIAHTLLPRPRLNYRHVPTAAIARP